MNSCTRESVRKRSPQAERKYSISGFRVKQLFNLEEFIEWGDIHKTVSSHSFAMQIGIKAQNACGIQPSQSEAWEFQNGTQKEGGHGERSALGSGTSERVEKHHKLVFLCGCQRAVVVSDTCCFTLMMHDCLIARH